MYVSYGYVLICNVSYETSKILLGGWVVKIYFVLSLLSFLSLGLTQSSKTLL